MLLYPFEEQLDLPPASIELGAGDCRQGEVVAQEHQSLAGLGVVELDAAQWGVEVLARVEPGKCDGLVADQTRAAIDWMRITALRFEVGLGTRHEEAARPREGDAAARNRYSRGP